MSKPIIEVRGLGKKYVIDHQQKERGRYRSLRDTLAKGIRSLGTALRRTAAGPQPARENFWALRDVSFDVQRGEVIGIIGRNGAGKSTLLKILSRITEPTEGEVHLRGRVASLLEVGTGFHPELTGRENVYLNGTILGMKRSEIRRKFDEIVAFAEVEKFLDTPVKRYSSGMYMRLAFAVAAHLEPEILVVDEVLAVGDAQFQSKCLGKMGQVAREGRTVLFVSHNLNAVRSLCQGGLWLAQGQIVEIGPAKELVTRYLAIERGTSEWSSMKGTEGLGGSYFAPTRFALVGEDLQPLSGSCSADTAIGVMIDGDIRTPHSSMTVGFAVTAITGELMFWSLATDQPPSAWPPFQPGRNRIVGWIPPHFLNEGDYLVELIVSLHFIEWGSEPGRNAPRLTLSIRGGLSESPFWLAARPGLNAPVLRFEAVEPVEAQTAMS